MVLNEPYEATLLFATVALAFSGGLVALLSRLLLESRHNQFVPALFFGSMVLLATVTTIALANGSHCWITGGGSLLFMSLVGTTAPGKADPTLY